MSPLLPQILWAQRKDRVLLTIDLQDAQNPQIKIDNQGGTGLVHFHGKARSHAAGLDFHEYEITLELYSEVNSDESQISTTARRLLLVLAKKGNDAEYWPRLLKSKDKATNVKVDWSKWVDEDEEDEKKDDFDLADLQKYSKFEPPGTSGLGDAGVGLDEEDSDDEDLPDLEPAQEK